jgi:hypothetical protein
LKEQEKMRRVSDAMKIHGVADATHFSINQAVRALKGPAKVIWPPRGYPGKSLRFNIYALI